MNASLEEMVRKLRADLDRQMGRIKIFPGQTLIGSSIDIPVGSVYKINGVTLPRYVGVNDAEWPGTPGEPIEPAGWTGKTISTVGKTTIDLSADFGLPADIVKVEIRTTVKDTGSAANDCALNLAPAGITSAGWTTRCSGLANDMNTNGYLQVPCNGGDIDYSAATSGANSMTISLKVWGYWI